MIDMCVQLMLIAVALRLLHPVHTRKSRAGMDKRCRKTIINGDWHMRPRTMRARARMCTELGALDVAH
jgi:hypothetical protein